MTNHHQAGRKLRFIVFSSELTAREWTGIQKRSGAEGLLHRELYQ